MISIYLCKKEVQSRNPNLRMPKFHLLNWLIRTYTLEPRIMVSCLKLSPEIALSNPRFE